MYVYIIRIRIQNHRGIQVPTLSLVDVNIYMFFMVDKIPLFNYNKYTLQRRCGITN